MKSLFIIIFLLSMSTCDLYSQQLSSSQGKTSLGLDIGLPYGGFGAHFSYNAADQVNVFYSLPVLFLMQGFWCR